MKKVNYEHVYLLKDKNTGSWIFTYWASSNKHKALFALKKTAQDAVNWLKDDGVNAEIVEL